MVYAKFYGVIRLELRKPRKSQVMRAHNPTDIRIGYVTKKNSDIVTTTPNCSVALSSKTNGDNVINLPHISQSTSH